MLLAERLQTDQLRPNHRIVAAAGRTCSPKTEARSRRRRANRGEPATDTEEAIVRDSKRPGTCGRSMSAPASESSIAQTVRGWGPPRAGARSQRSCTKTRHSAGGHVRRGFYEFAVPGRLCRKNNHRIRLLQWRCIAGYMDLSGRVPGNWKNGGVHGAPGPLVGGVGLPVLFVAYGMYRLIKSRHKAD